jgi:plastocyanin
MPRFRLRAIPARARRASSAAALLAVGAIPLPLHHGAHHHRATATPAKHGRHVIAGNFAGAAATSGHIRAARSRTWRLALGSGRKAHAANDPADTISDFKFTPATLTIHVGDTVTWTNNGPTDHTATASNGSFDTGDLKKGQSASHTFTTAGTVAYICTLHPFMHGTIVVLASTTSSSSTPASTSTSASGSGSGTTSTTTAATPAAASGPTLPNTGLDLGASALTGLALLGLGIGLRARLRRQG